MGRIVRIVAFGFVVGALITASGLAGVVVDPLGTGSSGPADPATEHVPDSAQRGLDVAVTQGGSSATSPGTVEIGPEDLTDVAATTPSPTLVADTLHAGAARASLDPSWNDDWETDACTAIDDGNVEADHVVPSLTDLRGWPAASPNCIYLGGFGIGPARVAEGVGHGGVWVRALAVSNGDDIFVYTIADTVGWFARYDSAVCTDCGVRDVREAIAADIEGVDVGDVIVGSTHTHAGADTYGGWGGIPDWYRVQIRDAAVAASKQAIANLEPATLTSGTVHLGAHNNERRDSYYSNADTGATWLRAVATDDDGIIGTLATFAAHPTEVGGPVLHADWPGATARRFEADGGVGVMFEGGLGNMSVRGPDGLVDCDALQPGVEETRGEQCDAENAGVAIADEIRADIAEAGDDDLVIESTDFRTSVHDIEHPIATNPGLTTLASAGLFDREFTPGTPGAGLPGVYHWSKQGEVSTGDDTDAPSDPAFANGCSTAGPTIITTVGAHRVGELLIGFAPGEIFSNIAEVVKEKADAAGQAMVFGQTNDALGYIIQSFEFDSAANAATEYGTQTHEYEEVFSIDHCFGDHVLETLLESSADLGFGR